MNLLHITTTKSLRAGIEQLPEVCDFCQHKTLYITYVGLVCETCGFDSGHEYLPDIVRTIREHTSLTRSEIAEKLGYSRATVKNYEWTKTSKPYLKKFKAFVVSHYRGGNVR